MVCILGVFVCIRCVLGVYIMYIGEFVIVYIITVYIRTQYPQHTHTYTITYTHTYTYTHIYIYLTMCLRPMFLHTNSSVCLTYRLISGLSTYKLSEHIPYHIQLSRGLYSSRVYTIYE